MKKRDFIYLFGAIAAITFILGIWILNQNNGYNCPHWDDYTIAEDGSFWCLNFGRKQ